jgi:hypothetical protein
MDGAIQQAQAAIDALQSGIADLHGQLQGCTPQEKLLLLQQIAAKEQQIAAKEQLIAAKEQQVVELRKQENLMLQHQLQAAAAPAAGMPGIPGPKWLTLLPCMVVLGVAAGFGGWQLRVAGLPRADNLGWTVAGLWGVVSAIKDAFKLEPPYRWMLTAPIGAAALLGSWLGMPTSAAVVYVLCGLVYMAVLVVGAVGAAGKISSG